jgi:anaphase-promoting complex subunit 11
MTWDVEIKEYHAIANWTWDAGDDVCSICRMPFDGCPPDCKVHSLVKPYSTV